MRNSNDRTWVERRITHRWRMLLHFQLNWKFNRIDLPQLEWISIFRVIIQPGFLSCILIRPEYQLPKKRVGDVANSDSVDIDFSEPFPLRLRAFVDRYSTTSPFLCDPVTVM